MKIVLQRVKTAEVAINKQIVGKIDRGYMLLVGFERDDKEIYLSPMLDKVLKLKLFDDEAGSTNKDIKEINGGLLIVSQFTLSANLKKGKKPSYSKALEPQLAEQYYELFLNKAVETGLLVQSGKFGAMMQVTLQNDGPVTLIMESTELFPALHTQS